MSLTDKETIVLRAIYNSAKGNGFDFGFSEDALKESKLDSRTYQGVLRELHKKFNFHLDPAVTCEATYTQISFSCGEIPFKTSFEEFLGYIRKT